MYSYSISLLQGWNSFLFFFFFGWGGGGGGGGQDKCCLGFMAPRQVGGAPRPNMSFTVETSRQLSFYQVFTAAIDGFATEGLGLLTIGD